MNIHEETLEIARSLIHKDPSLKDWVVSKFPELKEVEDEMIRKEIIQSIQDNMCVIHKDKCIAWLEKQVEQKPDDKCIGCNNFKGCITCTDGDQYAHITEQKPAWSEEDEQMLTKAISAVKYACFDSSSIILWLKSIKERMKGECISVTDEELAQAKKDAYNDALDKIEYHSGEPTFDDGWSAAIWYLKKKNAQPQNTWKPSEEQMEALRKAVDEHFDIDGDDLWHLYEDLKKLRKE